MKLRRGILLRGIFLGRRRNIKGAEYSNLANISPSTLLDIIRDEPFVSKENRKTWKHFTEKLRLKLPGSACTSTVPYPVPVPADDTPLQQIDNRTTDASRSRDFLRRIVFPRQSLLTSD
nr:probable E3 ubiquitin-protein ligase LOG2 [Ipomoea trifida]